MQTLDKLLTKWKLWINRDHTFQADELKELQSHLMEEINYLVNREGLSEEEAFHKAVSLVGEREGLDQEYIKVKSAPSKVIHWGKKNLWTVVTTALVLVFTLGYFLGWYPAKQENVKLISQLESINSNKKSYKPFVLIDQKYDSISKPKIGWEIDFKTVEDNINTVLAGKGLKEPPVFDDEGNAYFIDFARCLYSISPAGKLRWKKIEERLMFYSGSIVVVKDGILVITRDGLEYINKNGEVNWVKEGNMQKGPFLRNDGLVLLIQEKGNYLDHSIEIVAIDANGNTVWTYSIQEPKNSFINFETCFFDTTFLDSYFLFQFADLKSLDKGMNDQKYEYYIYKLSQDGYLQWNKLIPNSKNLTQFIMPSGNLVKNVFILVFWQYRNYDDWEKMFSSPKDIVAFNTRGEEVWKVTEKRNGNFEEFNYPIDSGSYFYTIFQSDKKSYLKVFSAEGLPWEVELKGEAKTPLKLDKANNVYIGIDGGSKEYINSYTSTGILRWSEK